MVIKMENKGNIKLINLKIDKGVPYDIYIGRPNKWLNLEGSKWANPFPLKKESERQLVLEQYETYLRNRPSLLRSLHELKGLTLACYCAPKACHGHALIKLYDEFVVE